MIPKLNTHLLSSLPRVLFMTHNEVSQASGISIACWYRLIKRPDRITVQQLISLANGLHIPVSLFFSTDEADVIGVRDDYVMQLNYQNCYYDSEAVHRRIGDGTATSWREAAEAVGMHWTNVSSSLLAVSRTPVTRLLALCEAFHFDLFEFLVDPNKGAIRRHVGSSKADVPDDLKAEIRNLREDVRQLEETVKNLSWRYDDLLKAHKDLLKRFDEHVRESFVGLAAEPVTEPEPDK